MALPLAVLARARAALAPVPADPLAPPFPLLLLLLLAALVVAVAVLRFVDSLIAFGSPHPRHTAGTVIVATSVVLIVVAVASFFEVFPAAFWVLVKAHD